ncbi:MAG: TonB-dependent receptor [Bacteroidetes bacterium]|nr:TonB-dependent receptor [Bacteroidota bacterium]
MSHRILLALAALSLCVASLDAQGQRGKLSGAVMDARTQEPLIGANVFLEGTTLGAATDFEGRYTILNIPPGSYSVIGSMLGYNRTVVRGVEVNIDRTTNLTLRLEDATIEQKEVVVTAERPKIIRDQTSTSQSISETQLKSAPMEGIRGALDLVAGFQKDPQGNYSVRGSGAYEVNYQINGVQQINASTTAPGSFGTSKADNSWKFDVNPLAVQQVQLISGGFSAEYGNAQAGVVKVVSKEGGPRFNGEVRVEMRPPGQYHFGPYVYDRKSYEWQRWGDFNYWIRDLRLIADQLGLNTRASALYNKMYQTGAATEADSAAWRNVVLTEAAWAYDVWLKNHTPSDDNALGVYDYRKGMYTRYLIGFGGPLTRDPELLRFFFSGEYRSAPTRLPTSEQNLVFQNYLTNVIYTPVRAHKFKLLGMYQRYRGGIWSGSDDIRWSGLAFSPPGISTKYYIKTDPVRTEETFTQSLNWVYTINSQSFIELTASHQMETYELPYEYLAGYESARDRLDSLGDVSGSVLRQGVWWDGSYFREPFNFSTNYYQYNRTEHASVSVDYTNQVTSANLLKLGLRGYYWDMVNNGVNSSFQANSYLFRSGFAEYYKAFPWLLSAYVQDKMEYEGLVANFGLRAEAYNFQEDVAVDLFDPFYQGTLSNNVRPNYVGDPATEPSKTRTVLMPRVGLSFPIGENTAFRIQYGHFASMPIFSHGLSQRTQSGWTGRGNPNLEPKKTINYEFGVQQVVNENHRFDVAVYYNDRVSQVGLLRVAALTGSADRPRGVLPDNTPLYLYTTFSNNAFGSTRGIEITFERIAPSRWHYRVSYNLSQTTEGNYGPQEQFPEGVTAFASRNFTGEFLSPSDRTHVLRALVQYRLGDGEGYEIAGIAPFANMSVSLTYAAQSGLPFTYVTDFDVQDVLYNRRYPIETNVDVNIVKTLHLLGRDIILGARIMNLLNNQWLTPMDAQVDRNNWVERGFTVADPGDDPLRLSYISAPYKAYRNIPRQVFLSVGFTF